MKMAAMVLAALLTVSALATVGECFQWTDSLQDAAFLAFCVHDDVMLPWRFSLVSGQTVQSIKWNFQTTSGQRELIATYISGNFFVMPAFSQRVQYLPSGGLLLDHVTLADSGNYTVEVAVREAGGTFQDYTRTIFVEVADGLRVREEPDTVYDAETDSWHATLSCGTVVSPDQSRDHIIWQTPSGVVASTKYEDGRFYLQLENPVKGGNYSCSLAPNSTASVCLPLSSEEPKLEVDEVRTRVSLLETENRQLKQRYETDIQDLRQRHETDIQDLRQRHKTEMQDLRNLVHSLVNTPPTVQGTAHRGVSFYARLSSQTQFPVGQPVILRDVVTNQGTAYSPSSGTFTAPYAGTYFFAATAGYHTSKRVGISVMVDETSMCHTFAYEGDGYYDGNSNTCTVTVGLAARQRVWLKNNHADISFSLTTTFTGFLISVGN